MVAASRKCASVAAKERLAADPVAAGELVVKIMPVSETATHTVDEGQAIPAMYPLERTLAGVHAVNPPAGLVDPNRRPEASNPTHDELDAHEIPIIELEETWATVGSGRARLGFHATRSPRYPSTATHNSADGQDTPLYASPGGMLLDNPPRQDDAAPVGSLELTTFPALSTATHNAGVGHETARNGAWQVGPTPS